MPKLISYSLTLVSDAEPSTGFGTELINALVPRDVSGKPIIPASHIKGLMKQALLDIPGIFDPENLKDLVETVFGSSENIASKICVTDAVTAAPCTVKTITRTSLNEWGTAKDASLRTSEAIAAGTVFTGSIRFAEEPSSAIELAIRYALLALMEVGGSRNRGCGACRVQIDGETRDPGTVFLAMLKGMENGLPADASVSKITAKGDPKTRVAVKLSFTAKGPLCVPELPVVGSNAIVSGFTIPASAVQGIVLNRINLLNTDIASACFASDNFRCFPLQPTLAGADGFPVRASATHKISKLSEDNGMFNFCDETIERYDWKKTPRNAPLKSADGVLVPIGGVVKLWRSSDMARHITAHGVINGEGAKTRNLYTVESLAETLFSGLVFMPEDAAELLLKSLEKDSEVSVGKSRSVRGSGTLKAERVEGLKLSLPKDSTGTAQPIFIVQSPILIEEDGTDMSVNEILKKIIAQSGWGEADEVSGSTQILFGWNRHNEGLQKAERVIAPGSVFKLKSIPADIAALTAKGLGKGRDRGFGAVLPHPGIAAVRYAADPVKTAIASSDASGSIGWGFWKTASGSGLTPSQISQLQDVLKEGGKAEALKFLKRQKDERPPKIWDRWKEIMEVVIHNIETDEKQALKALKVWHDLAVATAEKKGGK